MSEGNLTSKPGASELIEYMEACALIARNGADIHPQSKELRHHATMVSAAVELMRSHEPSAARCSGHEWFEGQCLHCGDPAPNQHHATVRAQPPPAILPEKVESDGDPWNAGYNRAIDEMRAANPPAPRYQQGCKCTSGALQPDDACPLHGDLGPAQKPGKYPFRPFDCPHADHRCSGCGLPLPDIRGALPPAAARLERLEAIVRRAGAHFSGDVPMLERDMVYWLRDARDALTKVAPLRDGDIVTLNGVPGVPDGTYKLTDETTAPRYQCTVPNCPGEHTSKWDRCATERAACTCERDPDMCLIHG